MPALLGLVKTRCISETLGVSLSMRKTLTNIVLAAALLTLGTAFAQTKQPEIPVPAVPAVPDKVMIELLQQEVSSLRAEVKHIHEEDIESIFQWLKFFKAEYDRVHSQSAEPLTRDRTGDKF